MKILIIRSYPSYLQVSDATYNIQELGLARALRKKGHVCDLLFWTDRVEEEVQVPVEHGESIRIYYRRGKSFLKNTVFTESKQLFEEYDVLQASEYNQMQSWLLAGLYPNKTVIYHGPYFCKFNKRYNLMCAFFDLFFKKKYIQKGTQFIVKSQLSKDFLVQKGISAGNITVAGVGIDLEALSSQGAHVNEPLLQELDKDESRLKLLYIGRFEPRRNIRFIVDVFKCVLERNSEARLYLIGTGEKQYVQRIFEYIEQAGIRDSVIWQERMRQNQLAAIYEKTDYFLLPTEYEIFGMVLLEAMYFGLAVLTTKNGGSTMLIRDGENGMIIEERNAKLWAERILELSKSGEALSKMQQAAKQTIIQRYTWDDIAESFLETYRKLS